MTGPDLILTPDQADDLRELLNLTAVLHHWLQAASDQILDDLASFAYLGTFHPRSYAHWLSEDLASLSGRLRTATNTSPGTLDTSASIGNQILPRGGGAGTPRNRQQMRTWFPAVHDVMPVAP